MKKVVVKKNRYVDSVSLMAVGDKVTQLDGVENAEAAMATAANLEVLVDELHYDIPEDTTANDLVLACTADTEEHLEAAMQMIIDIIDHKQKDFISIKYYKIKDLIETW